MKYVEGFSPHSSHSTLTGENHESAGENDGRHLEGRSSGSDIEGYEGVEHDDDETEVKDDTSAFKREPARKSLKSDHLDRWINMQEFYSGVSACGAKLSGNCEALRAVLNLTLMFGVHFLTCSLGCIIKQIFVFRCQF